MSSVPALPSATPVVVPSATPQASACSALAAALTHPPRPRTLKVVKAVPSALSAHLGLWLADEQHAILSATPQATWATGIPSFLGHNTAVRSVVMARLPKPLRAWLGRPVRVLGANGAVCETRLQRFSLRAQVTPDPAQAEIWDGCGDAPTPSATIAQQIWDLAGNSGRQLVAEFSAPCQGALLAVDPDLPAPAISAPEPASAELGERAQSEFRKLPAYAEVQARFKTEHPGAEGAWDDHEAKRSVWSLNLPAHTPLVFVSVEVGSGCTTPPTGFSASLSAVWAADGSAPLVLLAVPGALDDRRLTPRAVLDLEADGSTQVLLGPDGQFAARAVLGRSKTAAFAKVLLSSVPFFIGPC
ncbi:MAG: hypothetical protein ABI548_05520 [Polyangiaceae bacterium]